MADAPRKPLRSTRSYGKLDRDGFIHRSWMKGTGVPEDVFDGRPVIGIANTWSELVTCQVGLKQLAEHVKRGVWEAGGFPIEFPAMSLPGSRASTWRPAFTGTQVRTDPVLKGAR